MRWPRGRAGFKGAGPRGRPSLATAAPPHAHPLQPGGGFAMRTRAGESSGGDVMGWGNSAP